MTKIDPEQERTRLVEFYSQQMDGELEKVAGQAYELTDLAREALRAEVTRRGLGVALVENAPVVAVPSAQPGTRRHNLLRQNRRRANSRCGRW